MKEITRNSPLKAIIEGGISLYQTIGQERRADELHEIEKKIKQEELRTALVNREIAEERLKGEKLDVAMKEIEISRNLLEIAETTDVEAITRLPTSFLKSRLNKAYGIEQNNASKVISQKGLILEREAMKIIDARI